MTIPAVTRFDDFRIALWNLGDGSKVVLNPESLLDLQFETVPGVGGDRLKSATFQMPWYADARAAFDFDALQLVQIDRYSDPATTLWGIVLKPKEGYSGRVGRDAIQVQVVQVEELLKSRKVSYSEEDGGGAIHAATVYPDDFAKLLVRSVFSGTDVDGNARGWTWGSLVVEADASECADTDSFSLLSGDDEDDTLYKHVDALARTYDFDYQLKVTVTAGAFTFTFCTQAPYGGSDLTAGANRVMIKDLYNLVPSATRFRDAAMRATAIYTRGYADVLLDADAIATWGRWEGVAKGVLLADAEVALEKARVKAGAEYGFEATGANGMVRWLEDFKAGDKVLRINNRLGIAGDSEKIAAVIGRFQNKVLQLTIRWGDREPAMTDRQSGGGNAGGGGDGSVPIVAKPVQVTGSTGIDPHSYVYGDHEHALKVTASDAGIAAISATGVLEVAGTGGIATSVAAGIFTISGAGLVGPHTLLDGVVHLDTVAHVPAVGSLILGVTSTPTNKWDELVIGPLGAILISNGTVPVWTGGVVRGDLLVGVAGPMWAQLGIGAAGTVVTSNGLDVGWVAGITGTPGTCTVSSTNVGGANHTHAVTTSSDPGAAASILATDASGYLELVLLRIATANEFIWSPAGGQIQLVGNSLAGLGVTWNGQAAWLSSTAFYPAPTETLSLGTTGNRWLDAWLSGTVRAAKFTDITSDSFYLDPASTGSAAVLAGNIVMSATKTVDGIDVSEHYHHYDKITALTNNVDHTHTVGAVCDTTTGGPGHEHTYEKSGGTTTGATGVYGWAFTYTSTHTSGPT